MQQKSTLELLKKRKSMWFASTLRLQTYQAECLISRPPHFILSCRLCSISNHLKKDRERTVKHLERHRPYVQQWIEFKLLYFTINYCYCRCNYKIKLSSKYGCIGKNHSVCIGLFITNGFRYGVLEGSYEFKRRVLPQNLL